MDRVELGKQLKIASDILDEVEHQLPYEYEQLSPDERFLATIRQRIYSVRCQLGAVRMSLKDERNWGEEV